MKVCKTTLENIVENGINRTEGLEMLVDEALEHLNIIKQLQSGDSMSDIFAFDYNEEDGEILFLSPIEGFDETVHEIYSSIDNENEIEITTLNNGISISIPLFIEFYFPILSIACCSTISF